MRDRAFVASLVGFEALATAADVLLGPYARVHWEERFNARQGVQVVCGHLEDVLELQYRTFCGGCTAEALIAAPLFQLFGPTTLAWKLVPITFHLVTVAAGAVLALRASGRAAAVVFVGLMAAAPGFYRELSLIGWGNHAESSALTLLAACLVVRGVGGAAVAGLVAGLGLWFCHTSAYGVPALAAVALGGGVSRLLAFGLGLPLGLKPLEHYVASRPEARAWSEDHFGGFELAPVGRWLDWLGGDYLRWGLWDPKDYGDVSAGWWWFALWGLAGWGAVKRPWRFAPLAVGALAVAYLVRFDLWKHLPDAPDQPFLNLRYLAPLVPLLVLCAATRARLLAVPLVVFGLGLRLGTWDGLQIQRVGERVYAHDGWPDRAVPSGQPPQRERRRWGRRSDLEAARAYVQGHGDALPECRLDHLFELGRRVGLALEQSPHAVPEALAGLELQPLEVRFVADGIAKALVREDGSDWDARPSVAPLGSFADEIDEALARRVAAQLELRPADADARGWCEGRGEAWVREVSDDGARPVSRQEPPELAGCSTLAGGVGWAWPRYVGCGTRPTAHPALERWWSMSCALHRGLEEG